jgi:hypothetical protein
MIERVIDESDLEHKEMVDGVMTRVVDRLRSCIGGHSL